MGAAQTRIRRAPKGVKTYVELDGQQELRNALLTFRLDALSDAKRVIAESAEIIERNTKAKVAVSTPASRKAKSRPGPGETRDSVRTWFFDFGLVAAIGSKFFNFRFQEQGVDGRAGRPALNPSFQQEKPSYLARLGRVLNTRIQSANKGAV